MNRKTKLLLIALIIMCLAGMITLGMGVIEMMAPGTVLNDEVARFPIYSGMILSGAFTFAFLFQFGTDYKTWEKLK